MTPSEIHNQLATATGLPVQLLAAGVSQAASLAPDLVAIIEQAARGVELSSQDANFLFYGVHILAGARDTTAYYALMTLVRRPKPELDRVFEGRREQQLTPLLLSLYNGDPEPLYAALEDCKVDGAVKKHLFRVLARLTWEGRAPRDRLIDLLDRFDRDGMAPPDDVAWDGWYDAIRYLGLVAFKDRAAQSWDSRQPPERCDFDQGAWLDRVDMVAANPNHMVELLIDHVWPVPDPVTALCWMAPSDLAKADDETAEPGDDIELTTDEIVWLKEFLESDKVPKAALRLEALDGFFTALAIGPKPVLPATFMSSLWGTEGGEGVAYDSEEEMHYVIELLSRHWNTIVAHLDPEVPHAPILVRADPESRGTDWAQGFARGVRLYLDEWSPLFEDRHHNYMINAICALAFDDDVKDRIIMTDDLHFLIKDIHMFWGRYRAVERQDGRAKSKKVGRNVGCPCGSGRKYKRCCGASGRKVH